MHHHLDSAMSKKGTATREKILNTAQAMVLERGFSGMSVDSMIEALGMTKGAFFHHFKNKNELAVDLIERYAAMDLQFFDECQVRADKLSNDPLQRVLIIIGLYEESFAKLTDPYPGCLLASYIYELHHFDKSIVNSINEVFLKWRSVLTHRFEKISRRYPPKGEVNYPALADEFTVIIEGAFIMSKSLHEPQIVADQLQHYKRYIELLFNPEA
jgi:TetR/AcrR family transcriptional repressor of nem operon